MIYLDHAATTPLLPEVREAMLPFLDAEFGNPSSKHPLGTRARAAIDEARGRVARALGVRSEGVVFCSGGTEANQIAIVGGARARRASGAHVIIGPTEHPSVRASALALRDEGFEVEAAKLDANSDLDLADFESRLRADTVLVAQMFANNEVGTIYPIAELVRRVRARSPEAHVHVDAVQAFGKLDVRLPELGCDSLSISAHKVHGPKGSGALVLADPSSPAVEPLFRGGGQEFGLRPGTENPMGLVGFGVACEIADRDQPRIAEQLANLRRAFLDRLAAGASGLEPFEPGTNVLSNVIALEVHGPPAEVVLHHLGERGICVSTGSACQGAKSSVSPVLDALGLDEARARRILRISLSRMTTEDEVVRAAEEIAAIEKSLAQL